MYRVRKYMSSARKSRSPRRKPHKKHSSRSPRRKPHKKHSSRSPRRKPHKKLLVYRNNQNNAEPIVNNAEPIVNNAEPIVEEQKAYEDKMSDLIKDFRHLANIKNESDYDHPDDECTICLENPIDSIYLPCGHISSCNKCADYILKNSGVCPICRKDITAINKVFISY